jgi:type I restriction enzyme, S subunit
MQEWIDKRIKELCILGRGRVISQDEIANHQGTYPVYSSQSFNKGEMGKIDTYDFNGEYVTWTTDGAYAGTVFYREGKFNCTNVCGTLKPKDENEIDLLFLSYLLSTKAKKYVTYLGNPKLMNGVVAEIELNLPKQKSEQIKIAAILQNADKAIEQTQKQIAKYQSIKTGLMQDLLTKGIDAKGNIRSKTTHKFVVKNGIEVPEEWEVESYRDLCDVIKDGTHLPPKRVDDGVWLLGVSNIIKGEWRLTSSDTQIPTNFYNEMHKNWKIEIGDVLLAIVGATIGKVTQVPKEFPTFTLQRSICLLRGKKNNLSNDYLRLYIESLHFQTLLWNEVNVTAQPGIYLDTIGKFLLPKPSHDEQLEIVKRINCLKDSIDNLITNLNKLHSIKTGLMEDLLSGKVRVK